MLKWLGLIAWLALMLVAPASAQMLYLQSPTLTGNPIGNGYDFSNGKLYVAQSSSLAITGPSAISTWVKTTTLSGNASTYFFIDSAQQAGKGVVFFDYSGSPDFSVRFWPFRHSTSVDGCNVAGYVCVRRGPSGGGLRDGNWHHLCATFDGTNAYFYVDGVLRDQNLNTPGSGGGALPANSWYYMGSPGYTAGQLLQRDLRYYSRFLQPAECVQLYRYGVQGLVPSSGSLNTGLAAYWTFNGDTLDHSGNGNNATTDQTPPSISILTPSPGTVSGTISLTASATDPIGIAQVFYQVDGVAIGSSTAGSPWTLSWNSATFVDGAHTITASTTNAAGITGTASPVAITTSNGVTAKAYYFDSVAGLDSNNCTTTSTPCQTISKINSFTYHGGDSINLQHGQSWDILTGGITLYGNSAAGFTQNYYAGGSSAPLIITTYGGTTCNAIAGPTTDCATLSLDPSAAATWMGSVLLANAPNVQVSNIVFANPSNATALGFLSYAAIYIPTTNGINSGIIVNNVSVTDHSIGVFVNQASQNGVFSNSASVTVENSKICGSTTSVTTDFGIWYQGPNVTGTVQGNYVCNMNGHPTSTQGPGNGGTGVANPGYSTGLGWGNNSGNFAYNGVGTGMLASNSVNNWVAQYNVVNTGGWNANSCGAGYPIWTYFANNAVVRYNEVYNYHPASGGCDEGGFDLDGSTSYSFYEYNYSHNNGGPGYNLYQETVGNAPIPGVSWTKNQVRYNISENDGIAVQMQNAYLGQSSTLYNNTFVTRPSSMGAATFCIGWPWGAGAIDVNMVNNICYMTQQTYTYYSAGGMSPATTTLLNNAFSPAPTGPLQFHMGSVPGNTNCCSNVAAMQAVGWETGSLTMATNAAFGLTNPGNGGTCYSSSSMPPTSGALSCPTAYKLTTGSPLISAGYDMTTSPFNYTLGTDYYGNPIPFTGHGGTGYNIGADGQFH